MHSLSKIRRRMARLHYHESHLDQINEFIYALQLGREQDGDDALFLLVK